MKNILVISHDASRTGAPILLLNFLKWIKQNTDIKFEIILRCGGALEKEFSKIGKTTIYYLPQKNTTISQKILSKAGYYRSKQKKHEAKIFNHVQNGKFDLIYSNTIVNIDIVEKLKLLSVKTIFHIRELETTIDFFGGKPMMIRIKQLTDNILADSQAVKNNLIANHQFIESTIQVIPEYIPIPQNLIKKNSKIFIELGIPENAFVVGSCGSDLWRKGYDLFLQTSIGVCRKLGDVPVYFVWVGKMKPETLLQIEYELNICKLKDRILFIGEKENPVEYFSILDIFVLASREEPFGIVGLEAALYETPVLCFENSGGMPEFVAEDCGFTVPYLDLETLTYKIIHLREKESERIEKGKNARKKAVTLYSLDLSANKILNYIEQL